MKLEDKTAFELVELYSSVVTILKSKGVIRSKNVIGDLGEFLAIDYYNRTPGLTTLQVAPVGTQNIDAISRKGERYSIKSTSGKVTGIFYGLNDPNGANTETQIFEFVIIVIFNNNFKLEAILELDWSAFVKIKKWHKRMRGWNISVNQELFENSKIIYKKT